jgi:predicted amidohydrolase YtcJ
MKKYPEASADPEVISRRTFLAALAAAPALALVESTKGKVFATPGTGEDLIKLAIDGYPLMYTALEKTKERLVKPMHPKDQFEAIITAIHAADYQVDVHAVGDKAVDFTLDGFLKACGSASECRRRRHRIEHFPFRKLDSINRAADYGAPVCSQPEMITVRGDELLVKTDKKLVNSITPIATFMKAGMVWADDYDT